MPWLQPSRRFPLLLSPSQTVCHPLCWSPPVPCTISRWTVLRQTAQPRYALTLLNTKCKLYSRAVQTCQLRGFSCSGTFIGIRIGCFGVPGTCLNICCDFPLDFRGHSSCQINLAWQETQLIWECSTMPAMSTSVFLGCESQSHLSGALPVPTSCVALISLLSYFHLIFLAKTSHRTFKQTNQITSEQKFHGKASSTNVSASLQQLVCGQHALQELR